MNYDSSGSLDLLNELFTANHPDLRFCLIIPSFKSKPEDQSLVRFPLLLPFKVWDLFTEIP